jgi:preprotein translocase subunit SecD
VVNTVLTYAFSICAVLLAIGAYIRRTKRASMGLATIAAACAAFAAHYDSFWPMVTLGVVAAWAAFGSLNIIDLSWRTRTGLVGGLAIIGFLTLWPTFNNMSDGRFPTPQYIMDHVGARLVAGLDLRGGIRLVYNVDVSEAIEDKRDAYAETMRAELARRFGHHEGDDRPDEAAYDKLLKQVQVLTPKGDADAIVIQFADAADAAKVDEEFRAQFSALTFKISADRKTATFAMKDTVATDIRVKAVEQAREIILRRVDELGLKEAAVSTRDEDIIVEVPGTDEEAFQEIRDLVGKTAKLEFKLVADEDFFAPVRAELASGDVPVEGLTFWSNRVNIGKSDEGDNLNKTVTAARLEILPGETDHQALDRFRGWTDTLDVPQDREIGFELEMGRDKTGVTTDEPVAWRTHYLKRRTELTGDLVTDASASPDIQNPSGGWVVSLTFSDRGGRLFGNLTEANVGRQFAIILDDRVSSAPVINEAIYGGSGQITMGNGSPQSQRKEARELEIVLHSGALPAPIEPVNEQRIGPSLGRDSIKAGTYGALGGTILVTVFMILYYARAGLIADFAVGMNLFLQLAILASFGASMTLPGIAGLALTIGMSVDSNVLINERIREEMKEGRSPRAAVEIGYDKALSAIVDGHLTTLIAGIVLAQYGTGPIKGFAITLIVGVVTSIFSGVVVSRVFFDAWVKRRKAVTTIQMG